MNIFTHQDFDNHEQVLFCSDPSVGLQAIIAIHSTTLGPAAGGCRMHPYASTDEALTDVLRLSKGMSYKSSVAGLPLGGGKCVIIADPSRADKPELLRAFSKHVQSLNGRYWTAIDVGVGPEDADILAENCDYIFARASQYEPGFDPSSFTALGGFTGIRAAAAHVWGRDELNGLRVAIQGLGATGADLADNYIMRVQSCLSRMYVKMWCGILWRVTVRPQFHLSRFTHKMLMYSHRAQWVRLLTTQACQRLKRR